MKKRFSAFFLALALCLGLAVPAFAAESDTLPTVATHGPENSGILMESKTETYSVVGFNRSTDNTAVAYMNSGTIEGVPTLLIPTGMDIIITGAKTADEVVFTAWSAAGDGDVLRQHLFLLEPGKAAYVAPIPEDAIVYTLPTDGKTEAKGNLTAVQLGFSATQDGTIICDSDKLYELLETDTLLRISVGDTFWLFQLSGEPTLISSIFTDVDTGNWVSDPVAWALMNDITTGTSDTSFSPGDNCTQAQILTFLYRAAREEQAESSAKDMELAVQWAREKGMIDDSFDGSTPCTRATAVSYIWQAFNKPAAGAPASFTDVDDNASFAGAVSWAVEKGITNGDGSDTVFSPDKVCNRGQIVTFLYRAYNN